MESIFNSFLLVFAGEMGDKTQLLAIVLMARYKKPWTILFGIFVATLLNHALAVWAGEFAASYLEPVKLKWTLASMFFVFAAWILIPDKEGQLKPKKTSSVLLTTLVAFFVAEMGDKTQLATLALGAHYQNLLAVTLGSTLGMMASNALAIFLGNQLLKKISMKWVRSIASILFFLFGVGILLF